MSLLKKTGKVMGDLIPGLGPFTFDPEIGTVFVTSGTGVIGYRVAASLLEAGVKSVRVGIFRGDDFAGGGGAEEKKAGEEDNSEHHFASNLAAVLQSKGGEIIDFDWTDDKSYERALKGVKTVFCTIPNIDKWAEAFPAFLRVCKEKRVEHFIKISFLRSESAESYRKNVPFVQFHGTCDDLLLNAPFTSRISYTILCTSHLMSTPLLQQGELLRNNHQFITASYGMGVNYVSPNDVADAAVVTILHRKVHRNKIYNLTGSGPVFDKDVAKLLCTAYNTEIQHIELGYHDYGKHIKSLTGLPNWLIRDAACMEKIKASGIDELSSSYTKDLETIIGKKPETYAEYLMNKHSQRPGRTFP